MIITQVDASFAPVDPIANPELIPDRALFDVPRSAPDSDGAPEQVLVGGTAVFTIEFWALIQPISQEFINELPPKDERVWRQVGNSITTTVTTMERLDKTTAAHIEPFRFPPGKVYCRVTAGNADGEKVFINFA